MVGTNLSLFDIQDKTVSSVLRSFLAAGCDLLSCVLRGGFGGAKVYSCGLPNLSVGVGCDLLSEDDPIGGPFYLYCGWQ